MPWHARAAIENQLKARHFLRVHALVLFLWTFGIGYLASALLLALGHDTLWVRYALASLIAYLFFLLGVRICLSYVGAIRDRPIDDFNIDFLPGSSSSESGNVPGFKGGGGTFDGAGASADFDSAPAGLDIPLAQTGEGAGDLLGGAADIDAADAGDGCLPILVIGLLLLVAALLFALVGPELLIEVAFEAVLAGSLVSAMRLGREPDWMWAVLRKTGGIFLVVLFAAGMFGKYAQKHYPQAKTLKSVVHQMMQADAAVSGKNKQ